MEEPTERADGQARGGHWGVRRVAQATFAAVAVILLFVLLWQLSHVVLLFFAAVLFALILRSLADLIGRIVPAGDGWTLLLACVVLGAAAAAFGYFLGRQIASELSGFVARLPGLLSLVGERLGIEGLRERLSNAAQEFLNTGLLGKVATYASGLVAWLTSLVLVISAGIYLAARPQVYREGLLLLLPKRSRREVASCLANAGRALQLWLLGQLVSMALVGLLTTAGLLLLDAPSALALGFLAGLAEFIPLVGPALAAVPAILLSLSEGGTLVLWVIGLYVLVQQIEGNLIMPLVQRHALRLPAVLTLFAILSFGVLFGPLGILLATPMAVVVYVAVSQLYVRQALGEDIPIPGAPEKSGER